MRALKLRLKALFDFLLRLRRKSPPTLWDFGLAVREVIAARMLRAMTSELTAAEAKRMIMEKQLAVMRAHLAYTESILNGEANRIARDSAIVAGAGCGSTPRSDFYDSALIFAIWTMRK
jgi:hypothetical protein